MVVLAKQLKESSLMMNQSVQNTKEILDSTGKAIEHRLASTGRANVRATAIYSEFQDFLLNVACDVCDDMCIYHGTWYFTTRKKDKSLNYRQTRRTLSVFTSKPKGLSLSQVVLYCHINGVVH